MGAGSDGAAMCPQVGCVAVRWAGRAWASGAGPGWAVDPRAGRGGDRAGSRRRSGRWPQRIAAAGLAALAVAALSGCAALTRLPSEVSTFGLWPAGRAPGLYVFERLPSQQTDPARQQALEEAAAPALEAAGFRAATPQQAADVTVQLAARLTRVDPVWLGPGWVGVWRGGGDPWVGAWWGWGGMMDAPRHEREVAVLIRDRAGGQPLYEARAASSGASVLDARTLGAMFDAALKDFPAAGPNPRSVTVPYRDAQAAPSSGPVSDQDPAR
ncbi:MAG: DUF4136 domain-containing protein [Rubrivivax sp.]